MKPTRHFPFHGAVAALGIASLSVASGQTETRPAVSDPATPEELKGDTTPEALSTTGTVFSIDPDTFSVTPAKVTIPLNFMYNSKTVFVDEMDKAVPWERMRTSLPVTVNYTTLGEKFLATKVTVTRSMIDGGKASEPVDEAARLRMELVEAKKRKDAEAAVLRVKTSQTGAGGGTIMSFEQVISVRPAGSSEVVQYVVNNSTHYVDTAGQPVDLHLVRTGVPVSIHFVEDSGRKIATQLILSQVPSPESKTGSNATGLRENGTRPGGTSVTGVAGTNTGSSLAPGVLEEGFVNPPVTVLPAATRVVPSSITPQPGATNTPGSPPAPVTTQPETKQPAVSQPAVKQPAVSPAPAAPARR